MKKTIEMNTSNPRKLIYPKIIQKYGLKQTDYRCDNFRETIGTIVGLKNGIMPGEHTEARSPAYECRQTMQQDHSTCPGKVEQSDNVIDSPLKRAFLKPMNNENMKKYIQTF